VRNIRRRAVLGQAGLEDVLLVHIISSGIASVPPFPHRSSVSGALATNIPTFISYFSRDDWKYVIQHLFVMVWVGLDT